MQWSGNAESVEDTSRDQGKKWTEKNCREAVASRQLYFPNQSREKDRCPKANQCLHGYKRVKCDPLRGQLLDYVCLPRVIQNYDSVDQRKGEQRKRSQHCRELPRIRLDRTRSYHHVVNRKC